MNEISIRLATIEDAAIIHGLLAELEKTLGATSKIQRTLQDIRNYGFSETPCFEALLAWNGSEAIGLVLFFREFSSWKGIPGVYVQDLIVLPGMRGKGLGFRLMKAVFEHTRSWDAGYCKLAVHTENKSALDFYGSMGFREIENEHVLILDGL